MAVSKKEAAIVASYKSSRKHRVFLENLSAGVV